MKKIGLIALILFIFVAAAYIVTPKKKTPNTNKNTTAKTQQIKQYPQTADTKKKDQQMVDNMHQMLTIIANYYGVKGQLFPTSDAKGWQQIMQEVPTNTAFIDPYTNAYYTYGTTSTLDYNQIQFASNTSCDSNNNFVTNKFRSLAMRTRTVAGIRCVSLDMQVNKDTTQ